MLQNFTNMGSTPPRKERDLQYPTSTTTFHPGMVKLRRCREAVRTLIRAGNEGSYSRTMPGAQGMSWRQEEEEGLTAEEPYQMPATDLSSEPDGLHRY